MLSRSPVLLTPGPLTTSDKTKRAMLRDWGSRDEEFIALNQFVRDQLVALVGGEGTHVAVPMPGSGTLAVEAMLVTFVPPHGKLLVVVNGAYGRRLLPMCEYSGRTHVVYETAGDTPPDPAVIGARLLEDASISHVAIVDCETSSGILNPFGEIAAVVARHGRALLIDSMSAFGAVPIDARETQFDALAGSPTKCFESVPGMSFVIARKSALERCKGNATAMNLDIYDQWHSMENDGRWRFTPPTHVVAAFASALDQLTAEGGILARNLRYRLNCRMLVDGLRAIGLETLLPDHLQGPIIVTVRAPTRPAYSYERFYAGMRAKGYIISPGKFTTADTFRIGCIGHIGEAEISGALDAIRSTLEELGA